MIRNPTATGYYYINRRQSGLISDTGVSSTNLPCIHMHVLVEFPSLNFLECSFNSHVYILCYLLTCKSHKIYRCRFWTISHMKIEWSDKKDGLSPRTFRVFWIIFFQRKRSKSTILITKVRRDLKRIQYLTSDGNQKQQHFFHHASRSLLCKNLVDETIWSEEYIC